MHFFCAAAEVVVFIIHDEHSQKRRRAIGRTLSPALSRLFLFTDCNRRFPVGAALALQEQFLSDLKGRKCHLRASLRSLFLPGNKHAGEVRSELKPTEEGSQSMLRKSGKLRGALRPAMPKIRCRCGDAERAAAAAAADLLPL